MPVPLDLGEEEAFLEYLDYVLHDPPPPLGVVFKDRMNDMRELVAQYDELKSIARGARDTKELGRLLRDYHISVEDLRRRAASLRSHMVSDSKYYISSACASDLPATGVRELVQLCDVGEPAGVDDSVRLIERALTIAIAVDVARGWAQEAAAFYLSRLGFDAGRDVKAAASSLAGDSFRGRLISLARDLARASQGLCATGDYDKSERLGDSHAPEMIMGYLSSNELASAVGDKEGFLRSLAQEVAKRSRELLGFRSPSVIEEDPVLSAVLVLPALAGVPTGKYWRLAYRAKDLGFKGRASVGLWSPPRPSTCWGVLRLSREAYRDAYYGVFVDVRDDRGAADVSFSAYAAASELEAALSGVGASHRRASEVALALGLPPPPGSPPEVKGLELGQRLLNEVAEYANSMESYLAKVKSLAPDISLSSAVSLGKVEVREGWPVVELCAPDGSCTREPPIAELVVALLGRSDTAGNVIRRVSEALLNEGDIEHLKPAVARVLNDVAEMAAAGQLEAPAAASVASQEGAGATPKASAKRSWLELISAIKEGNAELVNRVATYDLVGMTDDMGWTPLHYAASMKYVRMPSADVVKVLISRGADVNARGPRGLTPLHLLAASSDLAPAAAAEIARILIKAGADPCATDANGRTPYSMARAAEVREVICDSCSSCSGKPRGEARVLNETAGAPTASQARPTSAGQPGVPAVRLASGRADSARKMNNLALVFLWPLLISTFIVAFSMPGLWFAFVMILIMVITVSSANGSIKRGHRSSNVAARLLSYKSAGRKVTAGLLFAFITFIGVSAMNLRAAGEFLDAVLLLIMLFLLISYARLHSAVSSLRR